MMSRSMRWGVAFALVSAVGVGAAWFSLRTHERDSGASTASSSVARADAEESRVDDVLRWFRFSKRSARAPRPVLSPQAQELAQKSEKGAFAVAACHAVKAHDPRFGLARFGVTRKHFKEFVYDAEQRTIEYEAEVTRATSGGDVISCNRVALQLQDEEEE